LKKNKLWKTERIQSTSNVRVKGCGMGRGGAEYKTKRRLKGTGGRKSPAPKLTKITKIDEHQWLHETKKERAVKNQRKGWGGVGSISRNAKTAGSTKVYSGKPRIC